MASAQVQHDGRVIESLVAARFPRRRRARFALDQTAQRRPSFGPRNRRSCSDPIARQRLRTTRFG